jgi:ribose-phosphate pyrophosphokinase
MNGQLKLFAGTTNPGLAEDIAAHIGMPLGQSQVGRFSDGEIRVEIGESVRGFDVFIVQSMSSPINDSIMELLVLLDALSRGSAASITAVLPYYAYARQDRQAVPRSPITAKLVADLITTAGATRVMGMDLHAGQIQGFFSVQFDHLYASPVLVKGLQDRQRNLENVVIVSPDAGGVERARHYSKRLQTPMAIIDKRRSGPNVAEVMHLIGDVKDKDAFIIDDMIDTAGTLTKGAAALREFGAKSVSAIATHAILSGPAVDRISQSVLDKVIVTDTIPLSDKARQCSQIEVLSVAPLIGEAILRVHGFSSVSSLFR